MPRKANVVALSDGTLLELSEREFWDSKGDFQTRVGAYLFLRIGSYSITLGVYDLAISAPEAYRTPLELTKDRRSLSDRLFQIECVESALARFGHPFAGLLEAEIAAERNSYR